LNENKFKTAFQDSALQVIELFHDTLESNSLALDTMSKTSLAKATNQLLPFVTMLDFKVWGANFFDSG